MVMSHEQQVRVFILKKDEDGKPFPDETMIALAKNDMYSGAYLSSITGYADKVIAEYADAVMRGDASDDEQEKPIRVQKVHLVLELITGLDRARAFMDSEPKLSEKIESDHVQGSITRETFNLTD
jgi:hypothetical protein